MSQSILKNAFFSSPILEVSGEKLVKRVQLLWLTRMFTKSLCPPPPHGDTQSKSELCSNYWDQRLRPSHNTFLGLQAVSSTTVQKMAGFLAKKILHLFTRKQRGGTEPIALTGVHRSKPTEPLKPELCSLFFWCAVVSRWVNALKNGSSRSWPRRMLQINKDNQLSWTKNLFAAHFTQVPN